VIDQMALQPTVDAKATAAKLAEYKAHIAKWDGELKEEKKTADEYQVEVERAEAKRCGSTWARRYCRSRWCFRRSRCLRGGGAFYWWAGAGSGGRGDCCLGVAGALRLVELVGG